MDDPLDKEDLERIVHALSHFRHNTEYASTLEKVQRILRDAPARE